MRALIAAATACLVVAACATADDPTTTLPAATTTTGEPPVTTTTSTTTPRSDEVFLQVDQPLRLIVTTADFVVTGTTSPGATVSVGDDEVAAEGDGGIAFFQAAVRLDPGTSEVIVAASDDSGAQATAFLSITYLPDATEEFAFLVEVGQDELVVDDAEFLTGEEADRAAVDAGAIEEGDSVPNGYFIRNVDPQLRTVPLDVPPVVVLPTAETGPVTEVTVPFDDWLALFDDGKPWPEGQSPPGDAFFAPAGEGTPYWLTIADGIVVQIRQQYLP